jgi:hypothetical protein
MMDMFKFVTQTVFVDVIFGPLFAIGWVCDQY